MKNILKFFACALMLTTMSVFVLAAPGLVDVSDSAEECISAEPMEFFGEDVLQNGTEENPYLITTAEDFNMFANCINDSNSTYGGLYYKLNSNVDFSTSQLIPFGTESTPFTGTLDGNGYALLNVTMPDKYYSGVVGYMTKGSIKNLKVEYTAVPSLESTTNKKYFFGGILGKGSVVSGGTITITGCQTSGDVNMTSPVVVYAAGIVAAIDSTKGNVVISNCLSDMSFDLTVGGNSYLSGFAAYVKSGSTSKDCVFKNCISLGDVSCETTSYELNAGSFSAYVQKDEDSYSGWASEDEATLAADSVKHFENCVALGNVNVKSNTTIKAGIYYGNKAGQGTVVMSNCYSGSEQTLTYEASKYTITSATGTQLSADDFKSREFYENTLGIDLENYWYLTNSTSPDLRTTAKTYGAAVIDDNRDVRLTSNPGIRFRSEIEVEKRNYAIEYGIIVVSKNNLGDNELTLDFGGNIRVGVAYSGDIDKFISKDDESLVFSAVVTNISEANYGSEIVARTYIKYVSEEETVVAYGDAVTTSLSASALEVRNGEYYEYLTDEQKALLETMLPKE